MKTSAFSTALLLCLLVAATASGQRVFDNFDRSQGVQVALPTPPPMVQAAPQKMKRNRFGKMVVVTTQNRLLQRTASVKPTASVTDSLALREAPMTASGSKLMMGSSTHLKGFTTGNPLHDAYIVDSSRRYAIDPLLIYAQMHQESSFKLTATSHKGASGLMQLMPATARRFGVTSIYDPRQNIEAGVKYMRWLLDTFSGDVVLALAGYNAGEGAVMKYGYSVPPYRETQEYVRRITTRYNQMSDGTFVHTARSVNPKTAQKLEQIDARPLTVYEPAPIAIKTADGKMILINQ